MDVLYHLTLRMYFGRPRGTTGTALLEEGLFELGMDGDIQREGKEVFAPKFEGTIVNPWDELEGSEAANEAMYLHAIFVWEWEKQKPKLQHEYDMAGFALSVAPPVWKHAAQPGMLGAKVRKSLEFVVKKLHQELNPNKSTWHMNEAQIVDQFWTEFEDFRNRRGYSAPRQGGKGAPRQGWNVPLVAREVFPSLYNSARIRCMSVDLEEFWYQDVQAELGRCKGNQAWQKVRAVR